MVIPKISFKEIVKKHDAVLLDICVFIQTVKEGKIVMDLGSLRNFLIQNCILFLLLQEFLKN